MRQRKLLHLGGSYAQLPFIKVMEAMNSENIFPRRYFYPSLNTLNYVNASKMEISESIAKRILCLPLSAEITKNTIQQIVSLIYTN